MPLQRPEKNALSFLLECEPGKIVVNKKVLPITAWWQLYAGLPIFESYIVRFDNCYELAI